MALRLQCKALKRSLATPLAVIYADRACLHPELCFSRGKAKIRRALIFVRSNLRLNRLNNMAAVSTMDAVPEVATKQKLSATLNGTSKAQSSRPKSSTVENFRPMSVIIIGAGFSGIYCGIRIPERLRNVKLTIYEKNAGVGGTWFENRYPGCACDIPGE